MNRYIRELDAWCAKVGATRRGYTVDLPLGMYFLWEDEDSMAYGYVTQTVMGGSHRHLWNIIQTARIVREMP